jgi:hypothetical protein
MSGNRSVLRGIPNWEFKLWDFIGKGDGLTCPLHLKCQLKSRGGWCPNEYLDELNTMIDTEQCNDEHFNFVKYDSYCLMFLMLERLAKRYLDFGGIYNPPVPANLISLFSERNNIEVRTVPLRACHGALWQLKDGWIIYLSSNEPSAMKRFVLFHEAFHMLAHSHTTPVFNKANGARGSFNEMLADFFSCSVLLPRNWAKHTLRSVGDIKRMANIFDIPQPFVLIRLKRMGLI